jgi:hypothetical protein
MEHKIGKHENMKLVDRIVLNGIVGDVTTGDDNYATLGVKNIAKVITFNGEEIVVNNGGFALTKEMAKKIGWGDYYASIRFVTADQSIDPTKVEEIIISSYYGNVDCEYYHRYSDYTGYLWTDEEFKVGGHDLIKILSNYIGKYIHMEIEMYKETV